VVVVGNRLEVCLVIKHFRMGDLYLLAILTKVHISHANGFIVGVFQSNEPRANLLHDDVDFRLSKLTFLDDSVLKLFL